MPGVSRSCATHRMFTLPLFADLPCLPVCRAFVSGIAAIPRVDGPLGSSTGLTQAGSTTLISDCTYLPAFTQPHMFARCSAYSYTLAHV